MKKIFLGLVMTLASAVCFAQAKKPTIMVVPSDAWCVKNGYVTTYDNQSIPDYNRAVQENTELLLVMSKMGEIMADRGFPLKDLSSVIRSINDDAAEDAVTTSKESGDVLAESPLDKVKKRAKADILMQVTWTVNKTGPKNTVTFNLQGIDAYTNKQIAAASGVGKPSFSAEVPALLVEGVIAHMDSFNTQLQAHFDDLLRMAERSL